MMPPLPTSIRLLLTLALLPTILPALADGLNRPPAASALTSSLALTFTSPLPPPTPAPLPATRLTLALDVAPAWAEPGDVVTFTVTVTNPGFASLTGLTLTDPLPDGLRYVAGSAVGFTYTTSARQLTWQPAAVTAGATITGSFQARVQGLALGATVTNTVTATAAGLAAPVHASAAVDVVSPRNDEAWVTPGQGGLLRAPDDRALLRVPPGAVVGRMRFTYAPATDVPNPPPGLRFAFRLEAQEEQGQAVREFPTPLDLVVAVDAQTNAAVGLIYYDETTRRWAPITAETQRSRRQLRAALTHFTLFAVTNLASGELGHAMLALPSLRGATSDRFSGAATFSYPIPLPPGAGGLTPQLDLRFNSRSRADDPGFANVMGSGWMLSLAGGISSTPWLAGSPDPVWHVDGAAFDQGPGVLKQAPTWVWKDAGEHRYLYRPDGITYDFAEALHDFWCEGSTPHWRTVTWVLKTVRDPAGNRIEYVYDNDVPVQPEYNVDPGSDRVRRLDGGCAPGFTTYLSQINLRRIEYNGGATEIEFEYAVRNGRQSYRLDGPFDIEDAHANGENDKQFAFFTTRLLRAIKIKQNGQYVAGYDLGYDESISYDQDGCARSVAWARSVCAGRSCKG